MNVLDRILEEKKSEIAAMAELPSVIPPCKSDFRTAISRPGRLNLIAEIKRRSPSQGDLRPGLSIAEALNLYSRHASAISVLTDRKFFSGSPEDLQLAATLTTIPLLRKDFIIDEKQIREARLLGASAYLLIVAALSPQRLEDLILCGRESGMPALVEVHNEAEMEIALSGSAEIIGINNRNLKDLSIDISTTKRLASMVPSDRKLTLVAESGYQSSEDLKTLPSNINAVLIGTAFMSAVDPAAKLAEMFGR